MCCPMSQSNPGCEVKPINLRIGMNSFLANIFDNPILLRELRRRMRGKALIYSIITYITLMTISTVFVLLIYSPAPWAEASIEMLQDMQTTGVRLYQWITGIQILLVLIVAPTITAGMTTGEKERKTFEFLRVTTITRWMYIMGCFLSTAFYVALALLCALPLLSLTFLYGGVTLNDVVQMFFYLLAGSCVLSSFGLFISSVCERTRTAQGIIVFLIFAVLFGGFILYQELQVIFAGAGGGARGASAGFDVVYLLNLSVPVWVLVVLGLFAVAGLFLLLSARKLFEPAETRAFAHWQFAVIFAGFTAFYLAFLAANPFATELPELIFFTIVYTLLLVAVYCFGVGRTEVGDEIWHLKRLFPLLRPFDQTIPFLVFIGLVCYYAFSLYPSIVRAMVLPAGMVQTMLSVSLASFAFFSTVGRLATAMSTERGEAGRYTSIVLIAFLGALPLLGGIIILVVPDMSLVGREITVFSPYGILIDAFRNPAAYAGGPVGKFATYTYITLAVVTGIYAEVKRSRRWRNFNYHYDMPAG